MPVITPRRQLLAGAAALAADLAANRAWAQPTSRTRVLLETGRGVIVAELADQAAPITVANFLRYVDAGRMTSAVFYRASHAPGVTDVGFIEAGVKDPAKLFPPIAHESTLATGLRHLDGTLSMARFAPGTAAADFTFCCGDAPHLDAHPELPGDNLGYAAFGRVIEGMETARAILALPTTGASAQNPAMQGEMLEPPVAILGARRV